MSHDTGRDRQAYEYNDHFAPMTLADEKANGGWNRKDKPEGGPVPPAPMSGGTR